MAFSQVHPDIKVTCDCKLSVWKRVNSICIEKYELMSSKHKKIYTTLNYIEHVFILASTITECILISAWASLLGILIGITSAAIGLQIWTIAARI